MKKPVTIKDFYNDWGTLFQNFDEIDSLGGHQNFDDYTKAFYSKQGCISCENTQELHDKFRIAWSANLYFIRTLFETMSYDYNPISNYDRYDRTYTSVKNADQKTTQSAAEDTHQIGGNIVAGFGDMVHHQESTYDSTALRTTGSDETRLNARTNKDTYAERSTTTAYQDEVESYNVVADDGTNVEGDIVTVSENKTSGNIGVMSTQDMIEAQRKVADFEYYKIVIERLVKIVCDGVI